MDEFQKKLEILKLITSAEHHFNNLTFNIRALASTWLLATFAGIGWILKDLSENNVSLFVAKSDLIVALCGCSSLGIFVLWVLDIKVYQQLLNVWFDGRETYEIDDQFPRIRANMKALFTTGRATEYIKFYYMVTCTAPLLIAVYIVGVTKPNLWVMVILLVILIFINIVIYSSSVSVKHAKGSQ